MKNTELYERLIEMAELSEDKKYIYQTANELTRYEHLSLSVCLADLLRDIKDELRNETVKLNGNKDLLKGCMEILKNPSSEGRKQLQYAFIDNNGYQWVCDGYCLVKLGKDKRQDLPLLPDTLTYINGNNIIPFDNGIELEIPDLNKLVNYKKTVEAEYKARTGKRYNDKLTYDFGDGLPLIDINLLIRQLKMFPNAKLYFPNSFKYEYGGAILSVDGDNKMLTLGCRPPKDAIRQKTSLDI